jgi:WD40-like Beta Propeller Repeat
MNADGSGQRRLAYGTQPRWSPDGRKIAYLKSGPLIGGLYVMNADGSAQQRLARNAGGIAWFPGRNDLLLFADVFGSHPARVGTSTTRLNDRYSRLCDPLCVHAPTKLRAFLAGQVGIHPVGWISHPRAHQQSKRCDQVSDAPAGESVHSVPFLCGVCGG